MRWSLNEITWDTLAAVATFAAVLVVLIPIWREAYRRKAHARGLRIGLCSKLTVLRPSLRKVAQCGQASFPNALLTKEAEMVSRWCQEMVSGIGNLILSLSPIVSKVSNKQINNA